MTDLTQLPFTISALHAAYSAGVSPEQIVTECFRRIETVNDPGIFIHQLTADACAAEARSLGAFDPEHKPLWGIPFVVKDNIDAAGTPTTAGCPVFAYDATDDAFVVAQLRDAGAILIGKANLDQFATGLVGIRSPYQPPKNSIDPEIVPGGSSSGSAVSVGHGFATFSLGTDTAGSGRVPAALNNIIGLKPSLGALSASGVVPACRTLDTISIFALTVEDAYTAFRAAQDYDAKDSLSKHFSFGALTALPSSFTVGIPSPDTIEFFGDEIQKASFHHSIEMLKELGATIVEIDFQPFYDVAQLLYEGSWVAERHSVIEHLLKSNPADVHPVTTQVVSKALNFSATDAFRDQYKVADLKRAVEPILATIDILCVPTIPTYYTVDDLAKDPVQPNSNFGTYTNFVNLLDMCGIAVPSAARTDGRPGSVTFLAKAGRDGFIASVASKLHQQASVKLGATDWPLEQVAPKSEYLTDDEMGILVCGAHMSGLPLNHQLTDLGGRFLKQAKTSNCYNLYSLAGGPPDRPGLVRANRGRHIAVEIWAIPKSAFGTFIAQVPAPLGIGTVTLDDGAEVKGFICENIGLKGATDITHFEGWRKFVASKTIQP